MKEIKLKRINYENGLVVIFSDENETDTVNKSIGELNVLEAISKNLTPVLDDKAFVNKHNEVQSFDDKTINALKLNELNYITSINGECFTLSNMKINAFSIEVNGLEAKYDKELKKNILTSENNESHVKKALISISSS